MSGQTVDNKGGGSGFAAGLRASFAARFGARNKVVAASAPSTSAPSGHAHTSGPSFGVTGLYGKLPVMGDFVSRRLPKPFVEQWDQWVQEGFLVSRERLGDAWLNLYLGMPIWRFCLPPGVISGHTWVGILVPSVDRVGRYFPLTLTAAMDGPTPDLAATFVAAGPWFDAAEALALDALRADAVFEDIDRVLQITPAPETVPAPDTSDQTMPLPRRRTPAAAHIVHGNWAEAAFQAQVDAAATAVMPPTCVWSAAVSTTPNNAQHIVLMTERLPLGRFFSAFLDGQWAAHGWDCTGM